MLSSFNDDNSMNAVCGGVANNHKTKTNKRKIDVAFVTVAMMGHVMPMIPYAQELIHRGHSVTFFHPNQEKYRKKLEECGLSKATSVQYDASDTKKMALYDVVKNYYYTQHYDKESASSFSSSNQDQANNNYNIDKKELPDVLVFDFFAVDATDAADELGIPSVGVFPNPRSINPWAASIEEQESLQWKVWGKLCDLVEGLMLARILWCIRSWKRYSRSLPLLPEQDVYPSKYMPRPQIGCASSELELRPSCSPRYHLVGPSLPTKTGTIGRELNQWMQDQTNKPIVYVAFGTMMKYTAERIQLLERQLLDLGDNVAVLWSLPKEYQCFLKNHHRENWKIESFVPQVALLESGKIGAFVTHCGSNSVNEAILCGVPMVCCPGSADQPANATRLARAGVGIIARKGIPGVGVALTQLLDNLAEITQRSKTLAKKLQSEGGAEKAAGIIEEVARERPQPALTGGRISLWPLLIAIPTFIALMLVL